jgi:hypothetical protein
MLVHVFKNVGSVCTSVNFVNRIGKSVSDGSCYCVLT